jgi:glycosyltransferase involved in cell wall biosynthesis
MISPSFNFNAGEMTGGGVPHAVFYLSKALASAGHDVSVLSRGTRRSQVPASLNFRLLAANGSFEGTMMSLPIRDEFDVYHAHLSKGIRMELASMALRRKSKIAAHVHYTPTRRVFPMSRTRLFYNLADIVLTPSVQNRNRLIRSHSLVGSKVKVLPNGVDCEKFRFTPDTAEATKARLGLGGRRVVLFVGHYAAPSKGAVFLVSAARRVVSEFPDTVFLFAGHGPEEKAEQEYMEKVESLIASANLRKDVEFQGPFPHSELPAIYSAADLFVQPSLQESFGMPLVEAMACARPVVATSVGIAPEAVNPGVNGYVVEPGDAEGLSAYIIRILKSESNSKAMGELARRTAVSQYSWDNIAANLLRLYAGA